MIGNPINQRSRSHSGHRFLLGWTAHSFAIWDRSALDRPAVAYPRTGDGWQTAWNQFAALEPNAMEVPAAQRPTAGGGPVARGAWHPAVQRPSLRPIRGVSTATVILIALTLALDAVSIPLWIIRLSRGSVLPEGNVGDAAGSGAGMAKRCDAVWRWRSSCLASISSSRRRNASRSASATLP